MKGMFVEVEFRGEPLPDRLVVPLTAIHDGRVYLVDDDLRLRLQPVEVERLVVEGIEVFRNQGRYQSSPSIRQFRPLPIPRNATRSPEQRNLRSSASAAVSGSDTVPMFPRNS